MSMNRGTNRRSLPLAVTLVDLLTAVTALVILIALAGSFTSRAKELSRRRLCALNLKSIGTSCRIYANDNLEKWPIPAHRERVHPSDANVKYVNADGTTSLPNSQEGEIGWDRWIPSTSQSPQNPAGGSTAVSVTRAFWMLVRSGDLDVEQFFCPSSSDSPDPTVDIDQYYDFTEFADISYGYQVPFGPRDTQPREGSDNRMILAADKGPFYLWGGQVLWQTPQNKKIEMSHPPRDWQRFNSPNHGGAGSGEGQNCLYVDGHVSFERRPTAGIDNDNIYTVMSNDWGYPNGPAYNLIHGDTVHEAVLPDPFPGQQALGSANSQYSSTDSLIYP